jgi:hypothetical protein
MCDPATIGTIVAVVGVGTQIAGGVKLAFGGGLTRYV